MAYIEKTYNYVYTVKLPETNEFYHGSRACYVLPEKDKYTGSFKKWKPNKNNLIKTIITIFSSRKEAFLFERELILKDFNDPLNRNYMIPNITFTFTGLVIVKNENGKNFVISNTDPLFLNGTLKSIICGTNNGMHEKSLYKIWIEKYGKEEADIRTKKLSKIQSENTKGENNPMFEKSLYDVWLKNKGKIIADNLLKEYKEKMSNIMKGENNSMFGKSVYDVWVQKYGIEEANIKMKKSYKPLSEERKNKTSKTLKGNVMWIYNETLNKSMYIKKELFFEFKVQGWIQGRCKKNS